MDQTSASSKPPDSYIGRRITEIRSWRKVSLRAVAELAGISPGYLSMIENGERGIGSRANLEAISRALRISPSGLTTLPETGALDPDVARALDHLVDVDDALNDGMLGEKTVDPRPWPAIAAEVEHLRMVLRPRADIPAQMALYPTLIRELNSVYAAAPGTEVLETLALVLFATANDTRSLGARGTPGLAAMHLQRVAEELDDPKWLGLVRYCRAQILGSGSRRRSHDLSMRAVDDLDPHLGEEPVRQLYGMLHLNSAMASATLGEPDRAAEHLQVAKQVAATAPDPIGTGFANLSFSETNIGFWEVALAVELGAPEKVVELSESIYPERAASWARQGAYFADLGRALAPQRERRTDAVMALVRAESLAPVPTRANIWVRETVVSLLRRVNRDDATGRELRGLAYRIGLAA